MNPFICLEWHLPLAYTPDDPVLNGYLLIISEIEQDCEVHRIWISQAIPDTRRAPYTRIIASTRVDSFCTLLPAQPVRVPFELHIRRPIVPDSISHRMKRYAGPWSITCEISIAGEVWPYSQALTGTL